MGYFPNGATGNRYEEEWCRRCIHDGAPEYENGGCVVWCAHLASNYEECNNKGSVLHRLIPRDAKGNNLECRMFVQRRNARTGSEDYYRNLYHRISGD